MRVIRWVLMTWSVLGVVNAMLTLALARDWSNLYTVLLNRVQLEKRSFSSSGSPLVRVDVV